MTLWNILQIKNNNTKQKPWYSDFPWYPVTKGPETVQIGHIQPSQLLQLILGTSDNHLFGDDEELKNAVTDWLKAQTGDLYTNGISKWKDMISAWMCMETIMFKNRSNIFNMYIIIIFIYFGVFL